MGDQLRQPPGRACRVQQLEAARNFSSDRSFCHGPILAEGKRLITLSETSPKREAEIATLYASQQAARAGRHRSQSVFLLLPTQGTRHDSA